LPDPKGYDGFEKGVRKLALGDGKGSFSVKEGGDKRVQLSSASSAQLIRMNTNTILQNESLRNRYYAIESRGLDAGIPPEWSYVRGSFDHALDAIVSAMKNAFAKEKDVIGCLVQKKTVVPSVDMKFGKVQYRMERMYKIGSPVSELGCVSWPLYDLRDGCMIRVCTLSDEHSPFPTLPPSLRCMIELFGLNPMCKKPPKMEFSSRPDLGTAAIEAIIKFCGSVSMNLLSTFLGLSPHDERILRFWSQAYAEGYSYSVVNDLYNSSYSSVSDLNDLDIDQVFEMGLCQRVAPIIDEVGVSHDMNPLLASFAMSINSQLIPLCLHHFSESFVWGLIPV
jgi:hypothetical protein